VSLMGRVLTTPIKSYYQDKENVTKFDWRDSTAPERVVHIGGTGVFAYHTDQIRFKPEDFVLHNAADINVGIKCNRLGVTITRIAPPKPDWIEYLPVENTIWDQMHLNDREHTELVNGEEWK